jgi:outer membrane protein assembly factor BamD (BamD/ComL family)
MNLSRNIRLMTPARWAITLGLMLFATHYLSAQDVEKLYQKGIDAVHNAQMEEACETLKQVENLQPGYQEANVYMKMACRETKKLYDHEEEWFNQGVQLHNQGKFEDARQKFQSVIGIRIKNPKFRAQAQQYLKNIEARGNDEKLYQDGARFLRQGKFSEARANFSKLAEGNGPRAGDAKNMLAQVDKAESDAKNKPAVQPPTESAQKPSGESDLSLRAGLQAYFRGQYAEADTSLSDYLSNKGPKQQLAYFFRGASHSAQYFLSGEKDSQQKDLALQDFRALKNQGAQFQPPQTYVSPKILALYREAVGAPSP